MKFHLVFFAISLLLPEIQCLNRAGHFEVMYMYAAYKMEWITTPNASDRKIGTKCKQTKPRYEERAMDATFKAAAEAAGLKGICSFSAFVKHVGGGAIDEKILRMPDLWTFDPTPEHVARDMNANTNLHTVDINNVPTVVQKRIIFKADLITNEITETNPTNVPYPTLLTKIDESVKRSRVAALEDQIGFKRTHLEASPTGPLFTGHWVTKTVTLTQSDGVTPINDPNFGSWQDIDWAETFRSAGNTVPQASKVAMLKANQAYGTNPAGHTAGPEAVAQEHQHVIDKIGYSSEALHQPC